MKTFPGKFSMTAGIALTLALSFGEPVWAAPATSCASPPPALPPDLVAEAQRANAYPSFCSIPPTPTDIPTAGAFRTVVIQERVAGARVVKRTGPETFSLGGTEDFAAVAKRGAAPPPPMATPNEAPTAAFIKALKARASPPPRPRKR